METFSKSGDPVDIKGLQASQSTNPMRAEDSSDDLQGLTGLQWKDGIGFLPGSSLKFRKNERGDMEVIMDPVNFGPADVNTDGDEKPGFVEKANRDSRQDKSGVWRYHDESIREKPGIFQRDRFVPTNSYDHESTISRDIPAHVTNTAEAPLNVKSYNTSSLDPAEVIPKLENKDPGFPRTETISQTAIFNWDTYLRSQNAIPTPTSAFKDASRKEPFPVKSMQFAVGDLLESVDPLHQSLICAVSVVEVKGVRMRLHFEGYATLHDFWVNADDKLIFPCGYCEKTGRKLHPPKNHGSTAFDWLSYASATGKTLSKKEQFREDISKCYERNTEFEIGDKLEAIDKSNLQFTCVATISDIIDDMILIHFDGWNHNYDYWCDNRSNYIHPIGWCKENDKTLSVPQEYAEDLFNWPQYLKETNSRTAPMEAFSVRVSHEFEAGMRLEVVDKRNPILVRVATVADKNSYQIKIHFDGWDDLFDYWIDVDSTDLHPVKWCERTGHILQPNITEEEKEAWNGGCPVPGCRGIGHIKGSKFVGHHSEYGCPYSSKNLDSYPIQDRIMPRRGPKPSSLMSRRIATIPSEKEKLNSVSDGDRRRSLHHQMSRNSVFDCDKDDFETFHGTSPSHSGEPMTKRLRHVEESKVEGIISTDGNNLRYAISSATIWSSFPDKTLSQYWDQCSKYLPGVIGVRGSEVCRWTSEDVSCFVTKLTGTENLGKMFLDEEIDGEAFLLLTQNDISKVLNIKLGPTLKIHGSILYARANE